MDHVNAAHHELTPRARSARERVFKPEAPTVAPFSERITLHWLVLAEEGYLSESWLRELINTTEPPVDFFYVENLEPIKGKSPVLWEISPDIAAAYSDDCHIAGFDHLIYAPNGEWGAYVSYDHYAMIGMHSSIDVDKAKFTSEVSAFLEYGKYLKEIGGYVEWIPEILTYLYGSALAHTLMSESDFL